jgi:hypothetical protein
MSAPFALFVPQHQGGGTGEFFRLLSLAQALRRRDADIRIEFLLPHQCKMRHLLPFPYLCNEMQDAQRQLFYDRELRRLRPTAAVFDKTCRGGTLRLCRRLGIRSACLSDEPGTCAKAFRADWLWQLDMHWHQRYLLDRSPFTPWQRALSRISSTHRLVFDACFTEEPPAADELPVAVARRLEAPFVLFVPGGGGYSLGDRPASTVFLDAAETVYRACGVETLTLTGTRFEQPAETPATLTLPEVSQAQLMALMRRALLVVTSGGGCLHQAMACATPTLAISVGGADQPARIAHYASKAWIRTAEPSAEGLVRATLPLLQDSGELRQMRERLAGLAVSNGIPLTAGSLIQDLRSSASGGA